MTSDPIWEQTFQRRDWGRYPNEELVRFVSRQFGGREQRSKVRLLEVGCAMANNVWYMAREGYQAHGIDSSPTAIDKGRARLLAENVVAQLEVGEVADLEQYYGELSFDGILDVGCLQCNRLGDVSRIIGQTYALLKPGGVVFSLILADWVNSPKTGDEIEPGTFENIEIGPLAGAGLNHFYTIEEIRNLFSIFSGLQIEFVTRSYGERTIEYKCWVVSARKD